MAYQFIVETNEMYFGSNYGAGNTIQDKIAERLLELGMECSISYAFREAIADRVKRNDRIDWYVEVKRVDPPLQIVRQGESIPKEERA